jgi:glycosyltransferase involved in cell wall biosynthesis
MNTKQQGRRKTFTKYHDEEKLPMRVLMFGWEFPPHISGGLGTACYGLASGLLHHETEVLFVVPRLFGDEDSSRFRFVNAAEVEVNFKSPFYKELLKKLDYIQVSSSLVPYLSPEEYSHRSVITGYPFGDESFAPPSSRFDFSGHYGKDLMKEVAQYALVASSIAGENRFDVIHAHDWLTYPAGIIAKQVSGKPLVIHVHATEFDRSGNNINQAVYEIERRGMKEADAVIAVSGFTKQILIEKYRVPEDKITVVHNGVYPSENNFKNEIKTGQKNKIVTFLGRVTFQKGPDYFIEAARRVLAKYPDTRFVMAGSGDMLNRMIKRVAELRIGSRFHFTGFLKGEDTDRLFAMSDVYVMPSVSEPFGISPLEAARLGVPVIISKQSGVSEVLKNALKVDFWDTDALADAICGLLNYSSLARKFSNGAGMEVEKLTWEDAALKVKEVYESTVKNTEKEFSAAAA